MGKKCTTDSRNLSKNITKVKPKVSIITITYNNAEGLLRTIKSVIAQSYVDYEYIIIDGGSKDNTIDIIKQFSNKITYWVSEPDKGVYNAMNKGIAVAKGDYLHFLNSGDCYASKDVLAQIFSQEHTLPLLRGIQICDYGDRTERWTNLGDRPVTLYDMYVNTMLHQATLIRRDMFEKYGLYDESLKIVSDWKFFLQLILAGENSTFLNVEIVLFEMDGISTNKAHGELHLKERDEVTKALFPTYLLTDYQRLKCLEKDAYISELVKKNKTLFSIFKVFNKLRKI